MYVLAENNQIVKYPYSLRDLKRDNPNVSFPKHFSEELLASYGVYVVSLGDNVDYDPYLQSCIADDAPTYVDGSWVLHSSVMEKTQEEKDEGIAQAAFIRREQRDELLARCDWTQVADAPVDKAVWATYRQALRDVSAQEGFPHNVVWPTKP